MTSGSNVSWTLFLGQAGFELRTGFGFKGQIWMAHLFKGKEKDETVQSGETHRAKKSDSDLSPVQIIESRINYYSNLYVLLSRD